MTTDPVNGLTTRRTVDAPRERVFTAWTKSDELAKWWGPKGFTNTFEKHEPTAGGEWLFVMHGPDGRDWKNHSRYVEVSPERIVFDHVTGPKYHAVVTFTPEGAKTRIEWTMTFESAAAWESVKPYAKTGNEENLDKLEALLRG